MSGQWYDLGLRLAAAESGRVVAKVAASVLPDIEAPVAVRAGLHGDDVTVSVATPGAAAASAAGRAGLDLLADAGVSLAAAGPATLVTDTAGTLPALLRLARAVEPSEALADTAAHVGWWADRADFLGGRAVVALVDACGTRWVTGLAPDEERDAAVWRSWLKVPDASVTGCLDVLARLSEGARLPLLAGLAGDDTYAFQRARQEAADGWDWRRPDTIARAALGLRERCDAADTYAAALLQDGYYRRGAVYSGHVVTGVTVAAPGRDRAVGLSADRMDARLRVGNQVMGWCGEPDDDPRECFDFRAEVLATDVAGGRLLVTVRPGTVNPPPTGQRVTVMPAPPNVATQRSGRRRLRGLYATRRSWLTNGRPPVPSRRVVPFDVLLAGAEREAAS